MYQYTTGYFMYYVPVPILPYFKIKINSHIYPIKKINYCLKYWNKTLGRRIYRFYEFMLRIQQTNSQNCNIFVSIYVPFLELLIYPTAGFGCASWAIVWTAEAKSGENRVGDLILTNEVPVRYFFSREYLLDLTIDFNWSVSSWV